MDQVLNILFFVRRVCMCVSTDGWVVGFEGRLGVIFCIYMYIVTYLFIHFSKSPQFQTVKGVENGKSDA